MSFTYGFIKTADPVAFGEIGKSLWKGLKSSGGHTVADTLKLRGLKAFGKAHEGAGSIGNMITTQKGREHLAEALGSATPSLAVGGLYGVAAKKVYDKYAKPDPSYGY